MVKSTRNRSPESKEEQLEIIVDNAIELFAEEKTYFSMTKLAKRSGLGSASSLYRYISGKRELWDRVCQRDFNQFGQAMEEGTRNISDPVITVRTMGSIFIDFATADFDRLERMFLTPPPPDRTERDSDKPANTSAEPSEQGIPPKTLHMLVKAVEQALQTQNIDEDPVMVAHYLWAMVLGTSILLYPSSRGIPAPYLSDGKLADSFKEFVLDHSLSLYSRNDK